MFAWTNRGVVEFESVEKDASIVSFGWLFTLVGLICLDVRGLYMSIRTSRLVERKEMLEFGHRRAYFPYFLTWYDRSRPYLVHREIQGPVPARTSIIPTSPSTLEAVPRGGACIMDHGEWKGNRLWLDRDGQATSRSGVLLPSVDPRR